MAQEQRTVLQFALVPLAQALVQYTNVCKQCEVEPVVQHGMWEVFLRPAWLVPGKTAIAPSPGTGGSAAVEPSAKRART